MTRFLILSFLIVLSGCTPSPGDFEQAAVDQLRHEQRLEADCLALGACLHVKTSFHIARDFGTGRTFEYICRYPEGKTIEGFVDEVTPFQSLLKICKMKGKLQKGRES